MRGLYIISEDYGGAGVKRKIDSQVECFRSHGIEIDVVYMMNKKIHGYKILARLPYTNIMPEWRMEKDLSEYDFVYMRRPGFMCRPFLHFLQTIRKGNESIKILVEIPSYPYDREFKPIITDFPYLIKDIYNRNKVHNYIDRVTGLGEQKEIFGVPLIRITNGYKFENVRARKAHDVISINIVAVARFNPFHGYERLIRGLKIYYVNNNDVYRKVFVHFIGDGSELKYYKNLVKTLGLEDYVIFYGALEQNEIVSVFDKCDIAVDALGLYKKGEEYSCTLKSREYLACGLPIIAGGELDVEKYDEIKPFICKVPNTPVEISIDNICHFVDTLYKEKTRERCSFIINEIRGKAYKYLDYQKSLDNVLGYLFEDAY